MKKFMSHRKVGAALVVAGVLIAGLGPRLVVWYAASLTHERLSEQWLGLGIMEAGLFPAGLLVAGVGVGAFVFRGRLERSDPDRSSKSGTDA